MALLTIGGSAMPTPSDISVSFNDISKADRNARGTMIIERIATKRKLEISYAYLNNTNLVTVLNAVQSTTFSVTYPDPLTNGSRTGTFYAGDRSVGMIKYTGGVPTWKDIKFDLIEV